MIQIVETVTFRPPQLTATNLDSKRADHALKSRVFIS